MPTAEMPSKHNNTSKLRVISATSLTGWSTPVDVSETCKNTPRILQSLAKALAMSSACTAWPQGISSTTTFKPRRRQISDQR